MAEYLRFTALALIITILIEGMIAYVLGFRTKKAFTTIALINMITNPVLNYLLLVNTSFELVSQNLALILFLEAMVVIVEWRLLAFALGQKSISMLRFSALINSGSFLVGLAIFKPYF
ncbi:MAG: hypothetical protein TUN42_08320 [Dehalogenimonas sp.]